MDSPKESSGLNSYDASDAMGSLPSSFLGGLLNSTMLAGDAHSSYPAISVPLDPSTALEIGEASSAAPLVAEVGGSVSQTVKKKRGRPRKYRRDDGSIKLGWSPTRAVLSEFLGSPSSEPPAPRKRGRPPGTGKNQKLAAMAIARYLAANQKNVFYAHIITINPGEDVSSKIMAFCQQCPINVCLISVKGTLSSITLRQPEPYGVMTYQGHFEILSLSGCFLLQGNRRNRSRTGGLTVSVAKPEGHLIGGAVAGMLMAASSVQVVAASFMVAGGTKRSAPARRAKRAPPPAVSPASPSSAASDDGESSRNAQGSPVNEEPAPAAIGTPSSAAATLTWSLAGRLP